MAKSKPTLIPMFTQEDLFLDVDKFVNETDRKTVLILSKLGEEVINDARTTGSYTDQTKNLRGSIGFLIAKNGSTVKESFSGTTEGISKAKQLAEDVAEEYTKGFVLIMVAGMEYAAAVESKGYTVISHSVPTRLRVESLFKKAGLVN